MASIKLSETKDGRRFFQICVSRGYGKSPYKTRWYWPDGWSKRTAEREAAKQAVAFELACKNGEVLNRAQEREKAAQEAAEAAKLKTVRQYADGVFMPTKEATFSENARSSYRMFLDKHIFPVLGDVLLTEVTPAMISKLLVDFQRAGYAHATAVKLYNILNGVFEMAFLDDSIPMNPMLKVKRPAPRKGEQPKEESDKAYTVQELGYILSCAAQEPLQWQTYISLAADTGLRRGELCGLQWGDIDFRAGTVTVRRESPGRRCGGGRAGSTEAAQSKTGGVLRLTVVLYSGGNRGANAPAVPHPLLQEIWGAIRRERFPPSQAAA